MARARAPMPMQPALGVIKDTKSSIIKLQKMQRDNDQTNEKNYPLTPDRKDDLNTDYYVLQE